MSRGYIVTRVMGIVMAALAVQFILNGITVTTRSPAAVRPASIPK